MQYSLAGRMENVKASDIREILKIIGRPGLISFAGGLPPASLFPTEELARLAGDILVKHGGLSLQYAPTEGYVPLREWIVKRLNGHWGMEHMTNPASQQVMEAHQLIDAGADCLICHHTHTMQTVENYDGKFIYYSIGNFIFDQSRPINARACAVTLKITEDSVTPTTVPVIIKNCTPIITSSAH